MTELGQALVDGASPNLLSTRPRRGSVTVGGAFGARASAKPALSKVRVSAKAAGAVRVPLRLNAAARKLRRKRALTAKLTIVFQPADGPALTTTAAVKLKRAAARRPSRTRAAGRRSAARSR